MYYLENVKIEKINRNEILLSDDFFAYKLKSDQNLNKVFEIQNNVESLFSYLKISDDQKNKMVKELLSIGFLKKYHKGDTVDAQYLAERLKAYYVRKSQEVWKKNKTLRILHGAEKNNSLAKGFLLETYHHVKGAKWTSAPVLGHSLSFEQRKLFEKFFIEERNHYKIFEASLSELGIAQKIIQNSIANTETQLLENFFHSKASASPLEFAVSLIVPEVDGIFEFSNQKDNLLDNLVLSHGIPRKCIDSFNLHSHDHEVGNHNELPLEIISSYKQIPIETAISLFETLYHTIKAYDLYFEGIYKKYNHQFDLNLYDFKCWL